MATSSQLSMPFTHLEEWSRAMVYAYVLFIGFPLSWGFITQLCMPVRLVHKCTVRGAREDGDGDDEGNNWHY